MPQNPYYNSNSTAPYSDFHVRPTMQLAGTSVANVEAMIDKAVAAGSTFPTGDGYFVRTADAARSVRWPDQQSTVQAWNRPGALTMYYRQSNLANTRNILFYQTGAASLSNLGTDTFVPGSIGDNLTSAAGDLLGQLNSSGQMSALRWLEAGTAGSFGTETEPCNHTQKFPQASVLVQKYFQGNTLLEAYTKSVQWPAQGVFVGDPLTKPFGTKATLINGTLTITTTTLTPGTTYTVSSAPSSSGPFTPIATISVPNYQRATITVPGMSAPYYMLTSGTSSPPSDTTPPAAPTNLAGTAVSSTQINITWTASADNVGVVGYDVYRNGNLIAKTTSAIYSDTRLSPATTYSYTVSAHDAAGNVSAQSSPVSVTTQPYIQPFSIGGSVKTTTNVKVRNKANTNSGKILCVQPTGALGTIQGGPGTAQGYTWWNVRFTTGCFGWVAQTYLTTSSGANDGDKL
jgi:chitodextrinase